MEATAQQAMRSMLWIILLASLSHSLGLSSSSSSSSPAVLILGGTGRIGTAIASHLLLCSNASLDIVLAGRNQNKGQRAVEQVLYEFSAQKNVEYKFVKDVWDLGELQPLVDTCDCLIHTAGPYLNQHPIPLQAAIQSSRCKTYIDVSDPLEYLDESLLLTKQAADSGTTALLCAGAFPGMSNVFAMEAASKHLNNNNNIRDVRFNYFTAGLGGSGDVNLYITNLGFGEDMPQYDNGKLRHFKSLSGRLLGKVNFYLSDNKSSQQAKQRIGKQKVFSWPFPEAATVARELQISGDSSAAMGTAPDFWNDMLGILVNVTPRSWWRSPAFSQFLADFSQPLVKLTDAVLLDGRETHGMRVDVTATNGNAVSIVQAHDSFRSCVGQSCAEFALDLMSHPRPGVALPEQRYRDKVARQRIIERLTTTPGTLSYTGPVAVKEAPAPSDMEQVLLEANKEELIAR